MPCPVPLLNSCCCSRSLRTGSYAAAVYSFLYYSVTIIVLTHFTNEEKSYLLGQRDSAAATKTILEPATISKTSVNFNIALLVSSIVGLFSVVFLVYGVCMYHRYALLPWIISMFMEIVVELVHCMYMCFLETVNFNPIVAVLFTLDFFLIAGQIYSLLCVTSLYQQYRLADELEAEEEEEKNLQMIQLLERSLITAPQDNGEQDMELPSTSAQINTLVLPKPGPPSLVSPGHRPCRPSNRRVQFPGIGPMDDGISTVDEDDD